MPLIQFLRITNAEGQIVHWLQEKYKAAYRSGDTTDDLETFANNYKMFGEQVVAADMLSWRNDRQRGQWLVLHVPFQQITNFLDPEIDRKVRMCYHYFASRVG